MRLSLCVISVLLGCAACASSDYPRRPNAEEIADAEGLYGLSDGYRAHLFGLDNGLWVRIGDDTSQEVWMMAPDRFASRDGALAIQFQHGWQDSGTRRLALEYERAPGGHPPLMFSTGPRPGRGALD